MRFAIILLSPDPFPGPAWHGQIGQRRRAAKAAIHTVFKEYEHEKGWYQPVSVLSLEEFVPLLKSCAWEGERVTPQMAAQFLYDYIPEGMPEGLRKEAEEILHRKE